MSLSFGRVSGILSGKKARFVTAEGILMEYFVVLGTALLIALYAFIIGRALGKLDQ